MDAKQYLEGKLSVQSEQWLLGGAAIGLLGKLLGHDEWFERFDTAREMVINAECLHRRFVMAQRLLNHNLTLGHVTLSESEKIRYKNVLYFHDCVKTTDYPALGDSLGLINEALVQQLDPQVVSLGVGFFMSRDASFGTKLAALGVEVMERTHIKVGEVWIALKQMA